LGSIGKFKPGNLQSVEHQVILFLDQPKMRLGLMIDKRDRNARRSSPSRSTDPVDVINRSSR
jgi:hypothetical protein